MKRSKLIRSILIPTLGIFAIGTIATVCTSCGSDVAHVTGVKLDRDSVTLAVNKTEQLTPTVSPVEVTDKSVTWSSDHNEIATVDQNGTITAVAAGTATITATSVNNPNAKDTCAVTVENNPNIVITANANSTLTLNNSGNNPNLQYSTDGGTNWTTYSAPINISQGQNLYLKSDNPNGWSHGGTQYSTLSITGDVSISGNVMGLLDNGAKSGEEGDITDIPCEFCFYELFNNSTGITSVSEDFLPVTTLAEYCYSGMFFSCSSLTTAPDLPAATLTYSCYSLMFSGCSSLTTVPELPATTLTNDCYFRMFYGCTSLTTAPKLPATTLKKFCYQQMFMRCILLTSIQLGYTGDYDSNYFGDWVEGVAPTGIFHYNGSQSAQDFGFPDGWTKQPL